MKTLFGAILSLFLVLPANAQNFTAPPTPQPQQILVIVGGKIVVADALVEPQVAVIGDDTAEIGDLVIVQPGISDSAKAFQTGSKFTWNVTQDGKVKRFFNDTNGSAVFASGHAAGKIHIELKANITYKVGTDSLSKEVTAAKDIVVGDPTPVPVPPPVPPAPIPPPVVVPDGALGLTKFIYNSFPANITADKKVALATELKNNFVGISSKMAAGAYPSTNINVFITSVFTDVKALDTASLTKVGLGVADFQVFAKTISDELFDLFQKGNLKNVSDWQAAFSAVADGFNFLTK